MSKSSRAVDYAYSIQQQQIAANSQQDMLEAFTTLLLTDKDNSKEIVYVLAICVAAIIIVIFV